MSTIFKNERDAMKAFREFCKDNKNIEIDFRSDVFAENEYGAYPVFSIDKAKRIVNAMFEFVAETNDDESIYQRRNTLMSLNELRTTKLKTWIECELFNEFFAPAQTD